MIADVGSALLETPIVLIYNNFRIMILTESLR